MMFSGHKEIISISYGVNYFGSFVLPANSILFITGFRPIIVGICNFVGFYGPGCFLITLGFRLCPRPAPGGYPQFQGQ